MTERTNPQGLSRFANWKVAVAGGALLGLGTASLVGADGGDQPVLDGERVGAVSLRNSALASLQSPTSTTIAVAPTTPPTTIAPTTVPPTTVAPPPPAPAPAPVPAPAPQVHSVDSPPRPAPAPAPAPVQSWSAPSAPSPVSAPSAASIDSPG